MNRSKRPSIRDLHARSCRLAGRFGELLCLDRWEAERRLRAEKGNASHALAQDISLNMASTRCATSMKIPAREQLLRLLPRVPRPPRRPGRPDGLPCPLRLGPDPQLVPDGGKPC